MRCNCPLEEAFCIAQFQHCNNLMTVESSPLPSSCVMVITLSNLCLCILSAGSRGL